MTQEERENAKRVCVALAAAYAPASQHVRYVSIVPDVTAVDLHAFAKMVVREIGRDAPPAPADADRDRLLGRALREVYSEASTAGTPHGQDLHESLRALDKIWTRVARKAREELLP